MADDPRPGADATFDVVVIGGGPAGCAAAVTLVGDGRSVLVVDHRRGGGRVTWGQTDPQAPPFRFGEGGPPGLDRAVDQVFGAGAFVREDHLVSFANRSAWGSDQPVDTDFMFNPFGPGWHLDRVAFDDRLRSLAATAGATLWHGDVRAEVARTDPDSFQHDETGRWYRQRRWTLTIETPAGTREVDASVVCDASGRNAAFARRRGMPVVTRDRLVAGVAVYDATATDEGPDDVDSATTLEAVRDGWWYTAAIPRGRRVVAYFADREGFPLDTRTTDGFDHLLEQTELVGPTVHGSAQRYALRRPTMLYYAGTAWLERPSGPGWLATGDAAACFDPLSSQGILTAILMGRTAGDAAISLLVDPDAGTDAYDTRYRAIVDRFIEEHRTMYGLERRWPDSPFWARRHGAGGG
jgi:flavin-dependent dehydrogenase